MSRLDAVFQSSTGRVFLGRTHNSAVPLSILESKWMRAIVREVG